jgi:uncharacterized membrane protein YuzA (DUF378 family)
MKHYNKLYFFCLIVVIIASINWGIVGSFNISLFEIIISNKNIRYVLYMIIGLSALYLCFQKSLWFPEYSKTLLPDKIFNLQSPNTYTHVIKVTAKQNKKIVYWTDDNYGVVLADKDNFARIKLDIKDKDTKTVLYYRKYNDDGVLGDVKIINI